MEWMAGSPSRDASMGAAILSQVVLSSFLSFLPPWLSLRAH